MKKKYIVCLTAGVLAMSLLFGGCGKVDPVAQKVMDKIDGIGEVTLEDEELIAEITETYNTLTDNQKSQVKNYIDLLEAEETIDKLKEEELTALKAQLAEEPYKGALFLCDELRKTAVKPESVKFTSVEIAKDIEAREGWITYCLRYTLETEEGGTAEGRPRYRLYNTATGKRGSQEEAHAEHDAKYLHANGGDVEMLDVEIIQQGLDLGLLK